MNLNDPNRPVVIGGVGGSGTRVVAELLIHLGWHLGDDLNRSADNLTYTLLFKRPAWYSAHRDDGEALDTGLGLLRKSLRGDRPYTPGERRYLRMAAVDMARHGHSLDGSGRGLWALARARRAGITTYDPDRAAGWGWKEPNSHLLLPDLARNFPGLHYVHTIRSGLDMAFSRNQQQLENWGPLFGVARPTDAAERPRASLAYWVRANGRVLDFAAESGLPVHLLSFEALCTAPGAEVARLLDFLGVQELEQDVIAEAAALVEAPPTIGRYAAHDLAQFDPADLAALPRFGYPDPRAEGN